MNSRRPPAPPFISATWAMQSGSTDTPTIHAWCWCETATSSWWAISRWTCCTRRDTRSNISHSKSPIRQRRTAPSASSPAISCLRAMWGGRTCSKRRPATRAPRNRAHGCSTRPSSSLRPCPTTYRSGPATVRAALAARLWARFHRPRWGMKSCSTRRSSMPTRIRLCAGCWGASLNRPSILPR